VTHDEVQTLLPGYALHALDDYEYQLVDEHVRVCERCRRELADFQGVVLAIGAALRPETPPHRLRRKVLSAIAGTSDSGRRGRQWSPVVGGTPRVVLAAAAAVVIVMAGVVTWLALQIASLRSTITSDEALLAVLTRPTTRLVVFRGTGSGTMRLLIDLETGRGVLVARNLSDPGPDRVYQVWLIAGGRPRSLGIFRPRNEQPMVVLVSGPFSRARAVAISVEPGPRGSPGPTTPPVFEAQLS
jgi:anti-sigma-K factor RskA